MTHAQKSTASKPYGDVTYADNGMQPDGKKRYPLDSEAHCRAAWSYIHQADNAAKYSAEDLAKIKAKIKAAGAKYGIAFAADMPQHMMAAAMTRQMLGVELARPGTWQLSTGPSTFTEADLRDAADFFTASGQTRIPIGFGHTDPRFDGDPAFGWVSNIRFAADGQGPVLLGDLVDMEDWVAAAAPARWPNRSVEGFKNLDWNGRTYSLALTRLALLGSTPPAMPTLRSLADLREAVAAAAASCAAEPIAAAVGYPTDLSYEDTEDPAMEAVVPSSRETEAGMDPAVFRERLGLDDDVSDDEVMSALAEAGFVPAPEAPAAEPAPVAAAATSQEFVAASGVIQVEASAWNEMHQRVQRMEADAQRRRNDERDQIISEAVRDGKFAPARRDHWARLWNADPEATRSLISTLARNLIPVAASGYAGGDIDENAEYMALYGAASAQKVG